MANKCKSVEWELIKLIHRAFATWESSRQLQFKICFFSFWATNPFCRKKLKTGDFWEKPQATTTAIKLYFLSRADAVAEKLVNQREPNYFTKTLSEKFLNKYFSYNKADKKTSSKSYYRNSTIVMRSLLH